MPSNVRMANISIRKPAEHWSEIRAFSDPVELVNKFVFIKSDCAVESILYSQDEHMVICCSTMSGCPMGCRFCGTGDYFVRNLTAEEIVSQPQYLLENCIGGLDPTRIQNLQIRVMSMGEPMLNRALWVAFRRLHSMYPQASLLISTSAPDIDWTWVFEMSKEISSVGLQFSVHESTNEARDALMPFKRKLTLERIAHVGLTWHRATGRRPSFNYCAHDANVADMDADRITGLYDPRLWDATVSVICERNGFEKAKNQHQCDLAVDFSAKLVSRGFNVRALNSAGVDTIGAGCGQLWFVQEWMQEHPELVRPSVGKGLPVRHTSREVAESVWQRVAFHSTPASHP